MLENIASSDLSHEDHLRIITDRIRDLYIAILQASSFSFEDSPLLNSWHEYMQPEDIDAACPEDVVFVARWES